MIHQPDGPSPSQQPAWGDALYKAILATSFEGFSGKVSFASNGDRNILDTPYFFWNFKGDVGQGGFEKIGKVHMSSSSSSTIQLDKGKFVVWPQGVPSTDAFDDPRNPVTNVTVARTNSTELTCSWSFNHTAREILEDTAREDVTVSWYSSPALLETTKIGEKQLNGETSVVVQLPPLLAPRRVVTYFKLVVGHSSMTTQQEASFVTSLR